MGAVCLHPGSGGGAQGFVPASRSAAAILCRRLGKGGGWDESKHYGLGGGEGSLGSGDSQRPSRRGGGKGRERWPSWASAPRGVGGGATRGTGIGKERLFLAPWQGFRGALEETGSALRQPDVRVGRGDWDYGDRWGGGTSWGGADISPQGSIKY